jgi:hypothetical protein
MAINHGGASTLLLLNWGIKKLQRGKDDGDLDEGRRWEAWMKFDDGTCIFISYKNREAARQVIREARAIYSVGK